MARELGLNPKNFGHLANSAQEPWKVPLPQFIENLYRKHFKKEYPAKVVSIEEKIERDRLKKADQARHTQNPGLAFTCFSARRGSSGERQRR
jgi:hypothetical protein